MSFVQQAYADMAHDGQVQRMRRAANATLRRAEHDHGRNMALLVACLAELRRLDPSNLIFNPQVQEKVSRVGGSLIDRSSSFAPLWELTFDLHSILKEIQAEHEESKRVVINTLESVKSESKRFFWRFWKKYGRVAGLNFPSVEAAEATRLQALQLARGAQMGDELNLGRLLRSV